MLEKVWNGDLQHCGGSYLGGQVFWDPGLLVFGGGGVAMSEPATKP